MGLFSRIVDWITTPYTIFLILKDPAIARSVKWRAIALLIVLFAYIVSPFDIIPDFIPLSGWLDDLIVGPLLIALARKITPQINLKERQNFAQTRVKRALLWIVLAVAAAVLLGLVWLGLIIYIIVKLIT
jgi:uncharacterized membrane protein YkvA (DUF1232 family)